MANLTLPEVIFLEEELRSSNSLMAFMEHARDLTQDASVKNLINQMLHDHQSQFKSFSRFLAGRFQ